MAGFSRALKNLYDMLREGLNRFPEVDVKWINDPYEESAPKGEGK